MCLDSKTAGLATLSGIVQPASLTGYLVRDAQPQHHGWMVAWHRGIVWILSNQDASPTQNGSDRPAEACTVGKLLTHPAIAKSATFTTYSIRITSLMIEAATVISLLIQMAPD